MRTAVAIALLAATAFPLVRLVGSSSSDDGLRSPATPSTPRGPAAGTYYVDAGKGSDRNPGTSAQRPWRSLARASRARLRPGDRLLFRRGATFSGTLTIASRGTSARPIVVGPYGEGRKPRFTRGRGLPPEVDDGINYRGSNEGACIIVTGSHIRLQQLQVAACRPARAGVDVRGDRNLIERLNVSGNEAALVVSHGGRGNGIIGNVMQDNNLMTVNTCDDPHGSVGDYGAYNVALEASSDTEVAYNVARGGIAKSCDYEVDGSMVEILRSSGNRIHDNVSIDNAAFAEVGGEGATDNTFAYNRALAAQHRAYGFVIHGNGGAEARRIVIEHNSVRLVGPKTLALDCLEYCARDILSARDNVFAAAVPARTAAPFDEDFNLYSSNVNIALGPHSRVGDPRFAGPDGVELSRDSPAIDAASRGAARRAADGAPDMGAVELGS